MNIIPPSVEESGGSGNVLDGIVRWEVIEFN